MFASSLGRVALGLSLAALVSCTAPPQPQSKIEHRVIYLHGAIVENEGPRGRHPQYGEYDFAGIVAALRGPGLKVTAEQRPRGTNPSHYADRLTEQVRSLISAGVRPQDITVIGASKGAVIAAIASTQLRNPEVRWVLMGNCNDWLIRTHNPSLSGRILSVYDASDSLGGSCRPLVERSPAVSGFSEIRLETNLGHGFLYRPLPEWVTPALEWARQGALSRLGPAPCIRRRSRLK